RIPAMLPCLTRASKAPAARTTKASKRMAKALMMTAMAISRMLKTTARITEALNPAIIPVLERLTGLLMMPATIQEIFLQKVRLSMLSLYDFQCTVLCS
ncbi:hypothetical protein H0H87_004824, partial [Tephrocybe sp. NHM501043]